MLLLICIIIAIYCLLVLLLCLFQRRVMYQPTNDIQSPEQYGLSGFTDIRATASDGVKVQLWYRPANPGFPTIIYYHGNAWHLGNRAPILGALAGKGFGVLGLGYRGFGKSEGSPSEQGIYQDARAAIGFLKEQSIPVSQIMLFGESLGTGVAIQMATEYDVAGLILQAPYKSVAGRAAEIYFYVPVKWLIRDKFHSIDKIAKVKAPLLLFHGEIDPTIPIRHGRAIFEAATSPKRGFFLPGVAHNDFDSGMISAQVLDFAKEHRLVK
jgi:fermentation-respiration switch protein FrsA (DUF1100 family)